MNEERKPNSRVLDYGRGSAAALSPVMGAGRIGRAVDPDSKRELEPAMILAYFPIVLVTNMGRSR